MLQATTNDNDGGKGSANISDGGAKSKKEGYRFGDLTKSLIGGSVEKITGKPYEFGGEAFFSLLLFMQQIDTCSYTFLAPIGTHCIAKNMQTYPELLIQALKIRSMISLAKMTMNLGT